MSEPLNKKTSKNQDPKKSTSSPTKCQQHRKQNRKGENPTRIPPELHSNSKVSNTWICKNSACRAVLSVTDTFCKRCSCCICHLFDDNKDPSLWLSCTSDSSNEESCGLSCHIECALQNKKVGVVNLGQLMQLDGSYCCASCGKVTGILGYWKKQLIIAKDARRVDSLCYRIYLSFRLLDGTSRFQELHEIVNLAKTKLETEVGPLSGVSAKMARGIVSRLTVANEVQSLCSTVIQKADKLSAIVSTTSQTTTKDGSLPAACKFIFEEITFSSVTLVLLEPSTDITGYKLWYSKTTELTTLTKEPTATFPISQKRILISNMQPCTEYTFKIISYTENQDLGHSEAKCFTASKQIICNKNPVSPVRLTGQKDIESDSGFKVRELGKILRFASMTPKTNEIVTHGLDLNIASVPDLNEDYDCDSDLINGSPVKSGLDGNFEYCVKIIRWLECQGYIKGEFRLKLLTWFNLRSTEVERRVVNTFIQSLGDDPCSLAGQLVDTFGEVVNVKRARHGFCSKLWH